MIAHTTWRDLFYKLAEAHPDCLMLNFTVKVGQVPRAQKRGEKRVRSALFLVELFLVGFSSFPFHQPHTEKEAENLYLCLGRHRLFQGWTQWSLDCVFMLKGLRPTWPLYFFRHQGPEETISLGERART